MKSCSVFLIILILLFLCVFVPFIVASFSFHFCLVLVAVDDAEKKAESRQANKSLYETFISNIITLCNIFANYVLVQCVCD